MKVQLAPGVLIEGTLKLDELLVAFATELALHNSHGYAKLVRASLSMAKILRHEHYQEQIDIAHELIEALSVALNELCPENHYFGVHPDDGACFGVWLNENVGDANVSA